MYLRPSENNRNQANEKRRLQYGGSTFGSSALDSQDIGAMVPLVFSGNTSFNSDLKLVERSADEDLTFNVPTEGLAAIDVVANGEWSQGHQDYFPNSRDEQSSENNAGTGIGRHLSTQIDMTNLYRSGGGGGGGGNQRNGGGDQNLFPPKITAVRGIVELGQTLTAWSMFEYADLDENPIVKFRFRDNNDEPFTGRFVLGNVEQSAKTWIEIEAEYIDDLIYEAGYAISSETVSFQAFDGKFWSEVSAADVFSVVANLRPPEVSFTGTSVLSTERIRFLDLVEASDVDGYPITAYYVKDRFLNEHTGYFSLAGERLESGVFHYITEDKYDQLFWVGGIAPGIETVTVRAYDGKFWSAPSHSGMTTIGNFSRPEVTALDGVALTGNVVTLEALFEFFDLDGNTMKAFEIFNTGILDTNGYFMYGGDKLDHSTWHRFSANDLSMVKYKAGSVFDSETFRIRVFDGRYWSYADSATLQTITKPEFTVVKGTYLGEFETLNFGTYMTQIDAGPLVQKYQIVDTGLSLTSGRLLANGLTELTAGEVYELTPTQMSNLVFQSGLRDNQREFDSIKFRGYNGYAWSDWSAVDFATEAPGYLAVDWGGASWAPTPQTNVTVRYSFLESVPNYYIPGDHERDNAGTFQAMNGAHRAAVREILSTISTFAGINFQEVSPGTGGELRFGMITEIAGGVLGWAYPPVNVFDPKSGDVWMATEPLLNYDTTPGVLFGFYGTMVHEIGHALGLKHPHDNTNGTGDILRPPFDSARWTVMSYVPDTHDPMTMMMYDIMALREKYGLPTSTINGDDTIYMYEANDAIFKSIFDQGGRDALNFQNYTFNAVIDLRQGQYSSVGGLDNNFYVSYGSEIEVGRGGRGDDELIGNDLDNILFGNEGMDRLTGGTGLDVLRGGAQSDTYVWNVGDGFTIIEEEAMAGRDVVEIRGYRNTDGDDIIDNLTEDFAFKRFGRDFRIDVTGGGEGGHGSIYIRNQQWGGWRVEILRIVDVEGNQLIDDIDLDAIFQQTTPTNTHFKLTEFNSDFGIIPIPV